MYRENIDFFFNDVTFLDAYKKKDMDSIRIILQFLMYTEENIREMWEAGGCITVTTITKK